MPLVTLQREVKNTLTETGERVEQGGVDYVGIPTGFHLLDETLSGLRPGAVYIIAGRPGMGKTALALNIGMNVARRKLKVLFVSLEMAASLLALRVVSGLSGVPASKIEKGRLTDSEHAAVKRTEELVAGLTFGIQDDSMTSEQLAGFARDFKGKHGLDLLIIDYVTLLRDQHASENERLTIISNNLVALAKELQVPVLLLAQLNREVERREGNEPSLADLRGSGSLEQDAFAVLFPVRPHYYAQMHDGEPPVEVEKDAHITIAKHRQGEVGRTAAWYHASRMLWTQYKPEPTPPPNTNMGGTTTRAKTLAEQVQAGRS